MLGGFNQTEFNSEMEYFVQIQADTGAQADIYTKIVKADQMAFNQAAFNTQDDEETLVVELPIIFSMESGIDSIAETIALFSTRIQADIEAISETSGLVVNMKKLDADTEGIAETEAAIRHFRVQKLTFTGEFKPGDTILIDTDLYKVLLNNQNALHLVDGNWFNLGHGLNKLTYVDLKSSRTLTVTVQYKDRWV